MQYSIVQKAQLEGALRLDAEYYQPEYLNLLRILTRKPHDYLKNLSNRISRGKQPIYKENGNIFAFTSDQIRNDFIDTYSARYTDEKFYKKNPKAQVKPLDVLLNSTGVGTLGRVNFYYLEKKAVVDGHITIIRTISENLDPIFLNVFLKTKYGQFQITRAYSGSSGQIELYPEQIREFLIFLPPLEIQKRIAETIKQAISLYKQSESLYSQAEDLLLEELGLRDFKVEDDLFYVVNLSEIKSAHRADAEYFQPKYEKLIKCMKKNVEIQELKTITTTKRGSLIDPRFYNETEGTPYIRGKDFSSGRLEKSGLVYISRDFRSKNETRVNSGDLVFALIGTMGTSALVTKEFDHSFISNNVGKISIKNKKEILPEYLSIVLNSIVGKLQFEKEASQTAQPKISDFQVRNFKIPILPKPTQQKIADLVQQSHEARKKAKQLLDKAKRKVEELIKK